MQVLDLFDTRYRGFTTKHFWDKLVYDHDFEHSYNWVRLTLQAHGLHAQGAAPWCTPAQAAAAAAAGDDAARGTAPATNGCRGNGGT